MFCLFVSKGPFHYVVLEQSEGQSLHGTSIIMKSHSQHGPATVQLHSNTWDDEVTTVTTFIPMGKHPDQKSSGSSTQTSRLLFIVELQMLDSPHGGFTHDRFNTTFFKPEQCSCLLASCHRYWNPSASVGKWSKKIGLSIFLYVFATPKKIEK